MVATMARNYGEEPEAEDLEPYGYIDATIACIDATIACASPERLTYTARSNAHSVLRARSQIAPARSPPFEEPAEGAARHVRL